MTVGPRSIPIISPFHFQFFLNKHISRADITGNKNVFSVSKNKILIKFSE